MITLKNEFLTASFNEVGAELKSLVYSGKEYIWEGRSEVWAGSCPLLFPICGGLKDDKYAFNGKEYTLQKHGYARFASFEVENKTDNSVVFYINQTKKQRKAFPLIMN